LYSQNQNQDRKKFNKFNDRSRDQYNIPNITGQRFGKLTVMKKEKVVKRDKVKWLCICDCGREKVVLGGALDKKKITSCGQMDCRNNS